MNPAPVLALAGLAVIGLLATRLPRPRWRQARSLDLILGAGGPLVLLGLALGPGIDLLTRSVLQTLAPVTALATGWIGATLGARFEWRYARRIPRAAWLIALVSAATALAAVALAAWLGARSVAALGAAWAPRLPAILALGAVAAASGPGAVALVARAVGVRRTLARAFGLVATLETAGGAVALSIPLALHRLHQPAGSPELGWLLWIGCCVGSAALAGLVFLALARLGPAPDDLEFALLATLLFAAGIGAAAELSPFLVCALAAAGISSAAPQRRAVRRVLADRHRAIAAVLLVLAGASLALPTAALLLAAPLVGALRIAAKWAGVRYGRLALKLTACPPRLGLGTVAQGSVAIALGLEFATAYGGPGAATGGAVLTTVVLGVAVAQLAAPGLMALAARAAPAPLTRAPALGQLSPERSSELTT